MSSYQIWAKWKVQDGNNPQPSKDYTLIYETHDLDELYNKQTELDKEGHVFEMHVTKEIEVVANFTEEAVE